MTAILDSAEFGRTETEKDIRQQLRYFFPLNVLISRWSRQRKKQQIIREKTHTGDMKHPHTHFISKNIAVLRNMKAHEVLEHGSQFTSGPTAAASELYNDPVSHFNTIKTFMFKKDYASKMIVII